MTALTQDMKTDHLGVENEPVPSLLAYPVAASTSIYGGAMVAINASGYAVPASAATGLQIVGRADRQALNQTQASGGSPGATGSAGSIVVNVRTGPAYYNANADSTITIANYGQNVYASDDNTVSLNSAGGTRPYAGWIIDPAGDMNVALPGQTAQVGVFLGEPNPYQLNPLLLNAFTARAVVTTLQAYGGSGTNVLTESSNGAISAADGVTLVVGDVVFIQGGTANLTAAKDSGPWVVTALGGASAKWVLTRPSWFYIGMQIPPGCVINVGGEGTAFPGTQWKAMVGFNASDTVGTNDPQFYPGRLSKLVTLASSTATVSTMPVFAAATTSIMVQLQTAGGTTTSTVGYGIIAAPTPGYTGTASFVIDALASGMGKNGSADASVVQVLVVNW